MNTFKRKTALIGAALLVSTLSAGYTVPAFAATPAAVLSKQDQMVHSTISDLTAETDTRTFAIDKAIEAKKVTFQNHYGFDVAGHLYLPKDFTTKKQYAAVVITGPFGAVKEQSSGLYAQELAKNGIVAVAFDPSTTGESSGVRRNVGSPEIFTEDFHAAIDFVSNLKFVNPQKVGVLGICGLGGMALTAASNDSRVKAAATSVMYDMSESIRDHYDGDYYTPAQRELVKQHIAKVRDEEAKTGKSIRGAHELAVNPDGSVATFDTMFPDKLPAGTNSVIQGFYDYYVGRAYHPRAINSNTSAWDGTTPTGFFDFKMMQNIEEIKVPVLMITGSAAHSKYFTDRAFARLTTADKKEIVVPGATHTDLYDQMDKIPFKELVTFFRKNLK